MRQLIADYLKVNPEQVSCFWKGRVALYAILNSIGIQPGDEIILPAFTCVVVVNPILYLKAKPIYVDIDPRSYTIDVDQIEAKISDRTRVILAQNTFGLAPDLDRIFEIAQKYDLIVIEDCAHGFGGYYKNLPNGTVADVSFFSTQWNKPFSTGIGGFAVAKDPVIARRMREQEDRFIKPSLKDEFSLKSLLFVHRNLSSRLYWPAIKTYRWLSAHNLILGSSQGSELQSSDMPPNFAKGMSCIQLEEGAKQLRIFKQTLVHRQKIAAFYHEMLKSLDIEPAFIPEYASHTFLKYPLLVKDRSDFFHQAEKAQIEIGDWFISPIHPMLEHFERFEYKWNSNPLGEYMAQHIINLPTHPGINDRELQRIAEFLKEQRQNVIDSFEEVNFKVMRYA